VQRFVNEVQSEVHNFTTALPAADKSPIVYVCTNEESSNSINEIKHAGFVMYHDLINYAATAAKARLLSNLNSLERFTLEAQLMIYSTHFIGFGFTSIHPFVKYADMNS